MIISPKQETKGQQLRHEILRTYLGEIDFYGGGVGDPFESKFDVLKDYEFW